MVTIGQTIVLVKKHYDCTKTKQNYVDYVYLLKFISVQVMSVLVISVHLPVSKENSILFYVMQNFFYTMTLVLV